MPRKDSKAAQLRVAARWIEFRALAKWQCYIGIKGDFGPSLYNPDPAFEPLIDQFSRFTADPPTLSQIRDHLARLPADRLRALADHAQRKACLFRPGRPERGGYDVVSMIEGRRDGTSIRSRSKHLAEPGRAPATLRRRYYRQRKSTEGE